MNERTNDQTNKRTYTSNKRNEKEDNNNTRHGYGNAENETHKTETVIHIQCKYFKMYTCMCFCMNVCECVPFFSPCVCMCEHLCVCVRALDVLGHKVFQGVSFLLHYWWVTLFAKYLMQCWDFSVVYPSTPKHTHTHTYTHAHPNTHTLIYTHSQG